MPNNSYSDKADLTAQRRTAGAGMDMRRLWMCDHLSLRGQIKRVPGQRPIMMLCKDCVDAKKAAKTATSADAPPT